MADTDSYEHLYDLPETTSTIGTDVLPIEQSDGTKKIGVQNLLKDATSYADIYTKSQTDTAITDKALTLQGNITAAVNAQATINTNLAGNFASGYSPSATYRAGDYCTYQNVLYKCTTAITTPEAWNASHWTVSKLADNVDTAIKTQDATNTTLQGNITSAVNAQATVNSNLAGNFASEYSPSATYAVNAYCTYQNVLYKCTTAITTPEAWNSAHWTAVKSMDETANLNANMGNLYVHTFNTASAGYVDITVPADFYRRSFMVYGDGNGTPFHGVIEYSNTNAAYNVVGGTNPTVSMINSTTLRFSINQWSTVHVVSDFKVS